MSMRGSRIMVTRYYEIIFLNSNGKINVMEEDYGQRLNFRLNIFHAAV